MACVKLLGSLGVLVWIEGTGAEQYGTVLNRYGTVLNRYKVWVYVSGLMSERL